MSRAGSAFLSVVAALVVWIGISAAVPTAATNPGQGASSADAPAPARSGAAAIQSWPLDDATTVVLAEDHRVPLVRVAVIFPAGTWSPWVRKSHAEEAFEIQLHDSAGRLRKRADALGAEVSLFMSARTSTLTAACHKRDLTALLALIQEVLANRDFDRHELSVRNKGRQIEWDIAQKQPSFRMAQAAARMLYAPLDPRRRRWEKPESLETNAERLAEARDGLIRFGGRTIGFAGDLTREEATRAATGLLPPASSTSPVDLRPVLEPLAPSASRPRETTLELPRLTQVTFGYGRDSLPVTDPDYPAFLIADHVLGGHFYSRLYVALRHEGGETYGAGTANYGDAAPGPYLLRTFTRSENAKVAEEKLRATLRVFQSQGITKQERSDAVSYLKGQLPFERQSPVQVLDVYLFETAQGLPPGFSEASVANASRLSLDEINRFVRRFYDPGQFSMIRVVPK